MAVTSPPNATSPGASPVARLRRSLSRPRWTLGGVVLVLVAYQLVAFRMPSYLLPGLDRVSAALIELITERRGELGITGLRFLVTMGMSMVTGWVVGLAMSAYHLVGRLAEPIVKIIVATPGLSWMLLAVIWFRTMEFRISFVMVVLIAPFFAISVYEGTRNLDQDQIRGFQQFRPTRAQVLRHFLLPASTSLVVASTKSVSGFAMRIMVFAELIASNTGVGAALSRAQNSFRVDLIIALTMVIVVFNFIFYWLVEQFESRFLKWRPDVGLRQ